MKTHSPQSLAALPKAELRLVDTVFFDIDDTFSTHGQIHHEAYTALWRLQAAGIRTIPVTGRPAGWCDMIARFWPVTAVIGENGAFYTQMKKGKLTKTYLESAAVRAGNAKKLQLLKKNLQRKFKNLHFASDQNFREFDLAIDYCEDVKAWSTARVNEVIDYCRTQGAVAKLSSIHINTWYGDYDKLSCVKKFDAKALSAACYLGDSPNDEPLFAAFKKSIGVANVRRFLPVMTHPPRYITQAECGEGFVEFVNRLIAARKK